MNSKTIKHSITSTLLLGIICLSAGAHAGGLKSGALSKTFSSSNSLKTSLNRSSTHQSRVSLTKGTTFSQRKSSINRSNGSVKALISGSNGTQAVIGTGHTGTAIIGTGHTGNAVIGTGGPEAVIGTGRIPPKPQTKSTHNLRAVVGTGSLGNNAAVSRTQRVIGTGSQRAQPRANGNSTRSGRPNAFSTSAVIGTGGPTTSSGSAGAIRAVIGTGKP